MQKFVSRWHTRLKKWKKRGGILNQSIIGTAVRGVARSVASEDEE